MDKNNQLKITSLKASELAKILKKSGSRYASEERIRQDVKKGAPSNPDGTINLVHYTAWLLKAEEHNPD